MKGLSLWSVLLQWRIKVSIHCSIPFSSSFGKQDGADYLPAEDSQQVQRRVWLLCDRSNVGLNRRQGNQGADLFSHSPKNRQEQSTFKLLIPSNYLEVKHVSDISGEGSLIIDNISMALVQVWTTSPALFKILATLGVLARLSTTPVLVVEIVEIMVLVSTPSIVRRIGRIRCREVAIGYRLLWTQSCAVVAGDAAVVPVFDFLQL